MSNSLTFETAASAVLGLYLFCIALWVWSPKIAKWLILLVNVATAGLVAAYSLTPPHYAFEYVRLMAIESLEGVAFVGALVAVVGNRTALNISYGVFVIHLFVSIAAVGYAFFVRFDRLI